MTPLEYKMMHDPDTKINMKLEKLEKLYIKEELINIPDEKNTQENV